MVKAKKTRSANKKQDYIVNLRDTFETNDIPEEIAFPKETIKKRMTFSLSSSSVNVDIKTNYEGWRALKTDLEFHHSNTSKFVNQVLSSIKPKFSRKDYAELNKHIAALFSYFYICLEQGHESWPYHFEEIVETLTKGHTKYDIESKSERNRNTWAIKLTLWGIYGEWKDQFVLGGSDLSNHLFLKNKPVTYERFRQQYITNKNWLITRAKHIARQIIVKEKSIGPADYIISLIKASL